MITLPCIVFTIILKSFGAKQKQKEKKRKEKNGRGYVKLENAK